MMKQTLPPTFPLYWEGGKEKAGIAHYRKEYGEFVLFLNLFPSFPYYLKAVEETHKGVRYRLESALKRNGRFVKKLAVGDGHFLREEPNQIHINLEPFDKSLTMEVK